MRAGRSIRGMWFVLFPPPLFFVSADLGARCDHEVTALPVARIGILSSMMEREGVAERAASGVGRCGMGPERMRLGGLRAADGWTTKQREHRGEHRSRLEKAEG